MVIVESSYGCHLIESSVWNERHVSLQLSVSTKSMVERNFRIQHRSPLGQSLEILAFHTPHGEFFTFYWNQSLERKKYILRHISVCELCNSSRNGLQILYVFYLAKFFFCNHTILSRNTTLFPLCFARKWHFLFRETIQSFWNFRSFFKLSLAENNLLYLRTGKSLTLFLQFKMFLNWKTETGKSNKWAIIISR